MDSLTKQLLGRVGTSPPSTSVSAAMPDANFDVNYQAVGPEYPPAGPSTYILPPQDQGPIQDMTFNDVSQTMFGDASFGDEIALANNANSGSDGILPGQVVHVPALSNTDNHNWQGDYQVYNTNAIIGPEYPNMPLPPVKPIHHSLWGELFDALVGIIGIVLDVELAGALTPELSVFEASHRRPRHGIGG